MSRHRFPVQREAIAEVEREDHEEGQAEEMQWTAMSRTDRRPGRWSAPIIQARGGAKPAEITEGALRLKAWDGCSRRCGG
jgi:hypothetical protein